MSTAEHPQLQLNALDGAGCLKVYTDHAWQWDQDRPTAVVETCGLLSHSGCLAHPRVPGLGHLPDSIESRRSSMRNNSAGCRSSWIESPLPTREGQTHVRIVIITGGSRGIGAATALACAERGMGVILTYNSNPESAASIVDTIVQGGGRAVAIRLDVAESSSFPTFADAVRAALQTNWDRSDFDFLVNNAGYSLYGPISAVTEAEFDGLFNVHLKGPFFLTQTLLPLITDGGQIVNLTSAATRVTTAGVAPYACFKGGLEVLTRYMAKEFGDHRIRVNAISPGPIRTELGGGLNDEFETLLASQTALGRIGEPQDVATVVASLLSDDNRWINAQSIEVAGGYVI